MNWTTPICAWFGGAGRNKAKNRILGQPLTPFGPRLLDKLMSFVFQLKGDFLADYRLTDYLVSVLSTYRSPALDGTPGNGDRLKKDLSELGIFHKSMPLYLLYRQREFATAGFCGFEGRQYSLLKASLKIWRRDKPANIGDGSGEQVATSFRARSRINIYRMTRSSRERTQTDSLWVGHWPAHLFCP